jgi:putative heme iron utilization protein
MNGSPIRPTDDEARMRARRLLAVAAHGALGTLDPETGAPMVTRVALALSPEGLPVTLVSDLAAHTRALRVDPRASLMVGDPGPKGDPLSHPRLTLRARARFVPHGSDDHARLRRFYLAQRPKSALYADFADFSFVVLEPLAASLNAGFGRAYNLTPQDLFDPA